MQFTQVVQLKSGDVDPRYTMHIALVRENRPKYWSFHCVSCGQKLCELDGRILYISDVADASQQLGSGVTLRCTGKFCRNWYQFSLN